jgi:hypothetical protein
MSEPAPDRARRASPAFPLPVWACLGLVLAAAAILHLPSLQAPFFVDDHLFIEQVRGRSLPEALSRPDPLSNYFRPVSRQLYFWLIVTFAGGSPLAFHVANLLLFLGMLVLLFLLVRRLAGEAAGLIASAFLALHYAADVPVRWACGSQELLAVNGALLCLLLHLRGRRIAAGLVLLLAALSKEAVLLTPMLAAMADRKPGEPWRSSLRRAWPLAAALAVWGLIWVLTPQWRIHQTGGIEFQPTAPLAVLVHLVQVSIGLEWKPGDFGHLPRTWPPWIPLALMLLAVTLYRARRRTATGRGAGAVAPAASAKTRRAIGLGLSWALLASVPIAAAAVLWSAYYYLFAMCGVALALGAWLARRPPIVAPVVLALLACGSASARTLEAFGVGRDPWALQSHINRHYIDRAVPSQSRYLADLKRLRPTLPPRSTLFFTGIKANIAFQTGDGPLFRWAYGDTSLRAYYLSWFTAERARRGAFFVFSGIGDSLTEIPAGPGRLADLALSLAVTDQLKAARDALLFEHERSPGQPPSRLLPWVQWALDDRQGAHASLQAMGCVAAGAPSPEIERALAATAAGDTMGAIALMEDAVLRRALDPGAHALLADLRLALHPEDSVGMIEALAARALAPEWASAWRRWAMIQARERQYLEALASFSRYFALAGDVAGDEEAKRWTATIRQMMPRGMIEMRN